jgi:LPXTG-motif cell wall-anchored protein
MKSSTAYALIALAALGGWWWWSSKKKKAAPAVAGPDAVTAAVDEAMGRGDG